MKTNCNVRFTTAQKALTFRWAYTHNVKLGHRLKQT